MPLKDGSGDLDFGASKDDGDDKGEPEESAPEPRSRETTPTDAAPETESGSEPESKSDEESHEFPYFVRRNKVGDERDERIEVHLRETVLEDEPDFRSSLANALGESGEISKTDAREFALKYAFENPEGVAELMREDGYGLID